jgi:hypothetical protein
VNVVDIRGLLFIMVMFLSVALNAVLENGMKNQRGRKRRAKK